MRYRSSRRWRAFCVGLAATVVSLSANGQALLQQGPGPATVSPDWYEYQGHATSGAVGAIAVNPNNPNQLYMGAANGGVWGSTNGGASWQPLTDGQASLSIGALTLNPSNPSELAAGIGRVSAAAFAGGPLTGIMVSNNSGQNWTIYGPSQLGLAANTGPNIDAITYAGGSIIAGAAANRDSGGANGIFLIDAAGNAMRIGALSDLQAATDPTGSLPMNARVTGLATTPASSTIYAAVAGMTDFPTLNGVYQSTDNGKTFSRILALPQASPENSNMRVATAANGAVYVLTALAGQKGVNPQQLLHLDPTSGTWSPQLNLPPAFLTSNTAQYFLTIAIDPKNSNAIYIGSAPPAPVGNQDQNTQPLKASNLYRGVFDSSSGTVSWQDIGLVANNPHADFRAFAFDSNGNVLLGSDGGLYENSSVLTGNSWQPLMNGYVGGEMYGVAWNPVSNTVAGAFQDNGDEIQMASGGLTWQQLLGADGTNVVFNAVSLRGENQAVLYAAQQEGSFGRFVLDASNTTVGQLVQLNPMVNGRPIAANTFFSKIVLNVQDPTLIAIGSSRVYVGRDDLSNAGATPDKSGEFLNLNLPVTDVTGNNNPLCIPSVSCVVSIAFGTNEPSWKYALLAADSNGLSSRLYLSPNITAPRAVLQQLNITLPVVVGAVVLDPATAAQFFAVGGRNVFGFNNATCPAGGSTCIPSHDYGTTLPSSLASVGAAAAIANNGVSALFVGGLSNVATSSSVGNIYALQNDRLGTWQNTTWQMFGDGLPNVQVNQLVYSNEDDLLAVATLGRGAWIIPDVTSYFPSAINIVLGNANFDSTRSDVFTDGDYASRPLIKVGTGTVTLTGANTYSGGTVIQQGTLSVSSDSNLGAPIGGITLGGGTLLNTAGFTSARNVTLVGDGGTFQTQGPLVLTGSISGPGSLTKTGSDLLVLASGSNTYGGPTSVSAGSLAVLGNSGTGPMTVATGAALGGTGTIGGSVANSGTLRPGPSITGGSGFGTLHVSGNYTQTAEGLLKINLGASGNDSLQVADAVNAGGTLALNLVGKIKSATAVVVSSSDLTGGFTPQFLFSSPFVQQRIVNNDTQVLASVLRNFAAPAQTPNQRAVADVLNNIYTVASQGDLDQVFTALDNATDPLTALNQLSGTSLGDLTTSTLQVQTMFSQSVEQRMAERRNGLPDAGSNLSPGRLSLASTDTFGVMATEMAQVASDASAVAAKPDPGRGLSVWARGVGGLEHLGSDGNGVAADLSGGGVMVGGDAIATDDWLIGASLGYVASNLQSSSVGSKATANNYQTALYSNWQSGQFFVDGQIAYVHADYTSQRLLSFGGLNRVAQGSPNSNDLTMVSRSGLSLQAGHVVIEPSLGFDWYRVDMGSFTESGAGSAGLAASSETVDVVKPSIGARVASSFSIDPDLTAIPEARVRYYRDVGDGKVPVTAALLGAPSIPFTTFASYPGRDIVVLGASFSAQRQNGLRLFVDYNVELADHLTAHTMTGGLRLTF